MLRLLMKLMHENVRRRWNVAKFIKREIDTRQVMTSVKYTTDCMRKVRADDGTVSVKRWVEERLAGANLQLVKSVGAVFHNGGRIA